MKKAFLRKTISAVVVAATMGTLVPLGVSAQWRQSTDSTYSYVQGNNVAKGWNKISNQWYYFDSCGKMKTGWINYNGTWYYTNNSGAMQTGWINDRGTWYYADSTGAMQTGVLKINGKTYCFNKNGAMLTGRVRIGSKIYTFAYNGQAIGTIPPCDKEFDSNNNLVKPNDSETVKPPTNSGNNGNTSNDTNNGGTSNDSGNTNKPNDSETVKPPTNSGNNGNISNDTNNGGTSNDSGSTNKPNDSETVKPPTSSENSGSTSNGTNTNVNGLPQIVQKYPITIQGSAETTILNLMNEKRVAAGLQPLTMDITLQSVARYKSNHMIQNGYFSHTNPDGTNWVTWLKALGYKYSTTGENIAYNQQSGEELFTQWWNSQGHRDNMMNAKYTKVGIGVVLGNGKYMGTQEFSN